MFDLLAESHLNRTVHVGGAAAEFAVDAKIRKNADLPRAVTFVPVAVETLGFHLLEWYQNYHGALAWDLIRL